MLDGRLMYDRQFAVKAVKHIGKTFQSKESLPRSEIYWNLLENMHGSTLRLTKYVSGAQLITYYRRLDDEIYEDFLESFCEYKSKDWDGVIVEDEMKSPEGKERWREFMMRYEKKVCSQQSHNWILPVTLARSMIIISVLSFEYHQKWNMKRKLQFLVIAPLTPASANHSPSDAVSCN